MGTINLLAATLTAAEFKQRAENVRSRTTHTAERDTVVIRKEFKCLIKIICLL